MWGKWANNYNVAQLQVYINPWNFKWGKSIQSIQHFPYEANGQMTITVHTYRTTQFHRTSNGENPSSGYRDMGSASLAATRLDRDNNTPPARRAER